MFYSFKLSIIYPLKVATEINVIEMIDSWVDDSSRYSNYRVKKEN